MAEKEAVEEAAGEYATKEDLQAVLDGLKELREATERMEAAPTGSAKEKAAKEDVKEAKEDVEEAAEAAGISDADIDRIADRITSRVLDSLAEEQENEEASKEKGALGALEEGKEPPAEETGEEEKEKDEAPGGKHWSQRTILRRKDPGEAE